MTVPLAPPMLRLSVEPVNGDAHLIWWLPAGAFTHGGDYDDRPGGPLLRERRLLGRRRPHPTALTPPPAPALAPAAPDPLPVDEPATESV